MSNILLEKFRERFPPVGRNEYERITTYPPGEGIERIHLDLLEKIFLDIKKPLIEPALVGDLAERIFDDINFDFYEHQEEGHVIFFRPEGIDDYSNKYSGHYIAVHEPLRRPRITISTGNRGSIGLHDRQRDKYFQFATELYDIFIEKAKSVKDI